MAGAVRGDVVVPADLTPAERTGLFDIMDLVSTGMTRDAVERDLEQPRLPMQGECRRGRHQCLLRVSTVVFSSGGGAPATSASASA